MFSSFLVFISLLLTFSSLPSPIDPNCLVKPPRPLSATQKNVIFSLTNIAENSQTQFAWTYAENIGDGRGITFGIIGFCSGTYDGSQVIKRVSELDPNNELAKYLPAFVAIDNSKHNAEGLTDNLTGLENFIADFNVHGADPVVKQAQMELLVSTYWNPTMDKVKEIGCRYPLTIAELYDICINHGAVSGGGISKGLRELVIDADNAVGSLISGTDEEVWLNALYDVRKAYMETDLTWEQALDRIEMQRRILNTDNVYLMVPFNVSCYGDSFIITGATP